MDFDQELDVTGLDCPLPLLKAKLALNELSAGKVLRVLATDPGSRRDFAFFDRQENYSLLLSEEDDGCFIYHIRKNG